MKKEIVLAAIATTLVRQCSAQSLGLSAHSAYEMRGIPVSDYAVVQPNIGASYKLCEANASGSYSAEKRRITDLSLGASCSFDGSRATLTPSIWQYAFLPDGTTTEAAVNLALKRKFKPSVFVAKDLHVNHGLYVEASAQADDTLGVPLHVSAAVAYNHRYYRPESGMSHLELCIQSPMQYKNLTLTPEVHIGKPFDGKADVIGGIAATIRR